MHLAKFSLLQALFISVLALILSYFFPVAGRLDRSLIEQWMTAQGDFYLRDHWTLATLGHQYVKWVLIFCAVLILLRWIQALKSGGNSLERWRYGCFLILLIVPDALIALLKAQSAYACPWDMTVAVQHHFVWTFQATAGHCFPGGHASAGFSIMAGYFIYRDRDLKLAHFYLIMGMLLGFSMGWGQMMRGAHFLSHNLWTGLIVWGVSVVIYLIFYRKLNPVSDLQSSRED